MSDEEDFFESEEESGEDFSASEDEWKPGKGEISDEDSGPEESSSDEGDSDSDNGSNGDKKRRVKGGKNAKSSGAKAKKISQAPKLGTKKRPTSSLRSRMKSKYNPPPKAKTKATLSEKVSEILSSSQFVQRQKMPSKSNASRIFSTSDSGSSDEDLVKPKESDYNSAFFASNQPQQASTTTETQPPNFDCNAGIRLSDSSDDDEDDDTDEGSFVELPSTEPLADESVIDDAPPTQIYNDFKHLEEFNRNLESDKQILMKLREQELASTSKVDDATDISKLLLIGEGIAGQSSSTLGSQKRKHQKVQDSDDSDWENVSEHSGEIKDIQITVGQDVRRHMSRDQKKAIDIEACLKRRLNREIKDRQVYLHKTSVLGWVAHGNHINRILNDMTLMEICLKMLPSKNAYPKGDTDIKYYSMFTDWFHQLVQLESDKLYSGLKGLTTKRVSLALQLQTKKIISKSDYVQLFVLMLRSIGVQCRMVINFAVLPLKPQQKDLFVISSKPKEEENETKTNDDRHKKDTSLSKSKKTTEAQAQANSKSKPKNTNTNKQADLSLSKKLQLSAEKVKQSNKDHHKSAHSSKTNHNVSDKDAASPNKVDSSQPSSKKSLKVNLARLSQNTIEREIKGPITVVKSSLQPHHSRSIDERREKHNSDHRKLQAENSSGRRHETSKSTATKNESTTSYTKKNATDQSNARKHDDGIGKSQKETKSNSKDGRSTSKAVKKKADEPLDKIAIASPPKMAKKTESKPKRNENEKKVLNNQPKPSPRKTRLRSRTECDSPKLAAKTAASAAFAPKTINTDVHSPKPAKRTRLRLKLPQMDGAHDLKKTGKRTKPAAKKFESSDEDSSSGSDFVPDSPKRNRSKVNLDRSKSKSKTILSKSLANRRKSIDRRVFSSDDEAEVEENTNRMDFWVEAYAEKEKKWVAIDPVKRKVNAVDFVRKNCAKPIIYVLAWNNDQTIRDVTPRYCNNFHTTTRKQRAEQSWIDEALDQFLEQRNSRTIIEDIEFSKLHMDTPMPTSINEFKNHPLYALERHLLKFEAIYPPNSLTLGFIRKEAIYARECVHSLHSREIWVKQARTVKLGEKPYKIVKARPKWNRAMNQMEEAKPLEIFGFWQTEPYQPPVAENGIVPRNAYGNVELFKPEMLPIGTRHLQLPNLNRVCKKMGVDCAQAVIGFDFHGGSSHPTFDGFVVCEEFADEVIEKWEIDVEEQARKEQEKRDARIYGNWKKLIKGLFIRERLKRKFNFGMNPQNDKKSGAKKKK